MLIQITKGLEMFHSPIAYLSKQIYADVSFSHSVVNRLVQLEKLQIISCSMIQEVVFNGK